MSWELSDGTHVENDHVTIIQGQRQAILRFLEAEGGTDITHYEPVENPDPATDRWELVTPEQYAKVSIELFKRDRSKFIHEVWLESYAEDGSYFPLAVRDVRTGDLWAFDKVVAEDILGIIDQSKWFDCRLEYPSAEGFELHLRERVHDCRACPHSLTCVTKGWQINVP